MVHHPRLPSSPPTPTTMTQLPVEDEQPLLAIHRDEDSPTHETDCVVDNGSTRSGNEETTVVDERFNPLPPSLWKRLALLLFIGFLFYMAFNMRSSLSSKKPDVVYSSRYSKEHKFRPAASPIITEVLKDGRTRLRGAYPTTSAPAPTTTDRKKRRSAKSHRASRKTKQKKRRTPARQ